MLYEVFIQIFAGYWLKIRSFTSLKPIPFSGKTCLTPLPPDLHQFGFPPHQQEQRRRWYHVELSSCKQQDISKMASGQLSHLSLYPLLTTWLQPPDWKKFDIAWHCKYESLPSCIIITSTGEEGLPELLWHIVACTQISRVDNNLLPDKQPPCLQPNPAGPGQQKANLTSVDHQTHLSHVAVHPRREPVPSQRISFGGVKPCRDQDQLGVELVGNGQDNGLEGHQVFGVAHLSSVERDVHVESLAKTFAHHVIVCVFIWGEERRIIIPENAFDA